MFNTIQHTLANLQNDSIPNERKIIIAPLIDYIRQKMNNQEPIRLNFICTHNSRRSHLSQIWAQTMAYAHQISNVQTYSGGTEATALYPMVVKSLEQIGFQISTLSDGNNPIYAIKYDQNESSIIGFSKKYNDSFNPQSGYAAIMTCSQADQGCPLILGSDLRVPITYEDPKLYDDTPLQAEKYMERSIQIATEMNYIFKQAHLK